MAHGVADPATLAAVANQRLATPPAQLQEALRGQLDSASRLLLKMLLEQWEQLAAHIAQLEVQMIAALSNWEQATARLLEIPGISGVAAQRSAGWSKKTKRALTGKSAPGPSTDWPAYGRVSPSHRPIESSFGATYARGSGRLD